MFRCLSGGLEHLGRASYDESPDAPPLLTWSFTRDCPVEYTHQRTLSGPHGANIFNPRSWGNNTIESTNNITLEFFRVVIAIGVFAIGVELPKKYMYRHWKSLFFLLVPVMTWVRFALYIHPPVRS